MDINDNVSKEEEEKNGMFQTKTKNVSSISSITCIDKRDNHDNKKYAVDSVANYSSPPDNALKNTSAINCAA
eukprot:12729672-Ditylum_brightwellii.AAC.1